MDELEPGTIASAQIYLLTDCFISRKVLNLRLEKRKLLGWLAWVQNNLQG